MKTKEEILSEVSGWDIVSVNQPEMQKEIIISFSTALKAMEVYTKQQQFKCMSCEKDIPLNEQLIFCSDCVK